MVGLGGFLVDRVPDLLAFRDRTRALRKPLEVGADVDIPCSDLGNGSRPADVHPSWQQPTATPWATPTRTYGIDESAITERGGVIVIRVEHDRDGVPADGFFGDGVFADGVFAVAEAQISMQSSGQLAQVYGFTDLDGSQPDAWRYMKEVESAGKPADATGYR